MKFVDGISVSDLETLRASVEAELKELGIKLGKEKEHKEPLRSITGTLFGNYLSNLPLAVVRQDDLCLEVPHFLVKSFELIRCHVTCEGLFRKAGSVQRQRELKKCLESGGCLRGSDVVHDVANLVKQFLRSLASPLIHPRLHDSLVKAFDAGNSLAVLLLCAHMRLVHLHTLRYIMTFFAEVASNCDTNKMNSHNLAVVLAPNIFIKREVSESKLNKGQVLHRETALVQWMIENADQIGFVPAHLIPNGFTSFVLSTNDVVVNGKRTKRAKKRNSLNGMFNGLRKMVQPQRVLPQVPDNPMEMEDRSRATAKDVKNSSVAKRKCDENDDSHSYIPKKSPRCEFAMVHHDTPTPLMVLLRDEGHVSTAPDVDEPLALHKSHPESRKRLSTRMKLFGKNYLRQRSSLEQQTPKSVKPGLAENKSVVGSAQMSRLSKRFPGNKQCLVRSSPNLPTVIHAFQTPDKQSIVQASVNLSDLRPAVDNSKVQVDDAVCPTFKLNKRRSVERHFRSDDNILASSKARRISVKRAASAAAAAAGNPGRKLAAVRGVLNVNDEDPFVKPTLLNRSLRRGRPNTVNSGLPPESPFKTPKVEDDLISNRDYFTPGDVMEHSFVYETPIFSMTKWHKNLSLEKQLEQNNDKDEVKKALDLSEDNSLYTSVEDLLDKKSIKALPKSDSGIFDLDEMRDDHSSMDFVLMESKGPSDKPDLLSIDSGMTDSTSNPLDEDETTKSKTLHRKSMSLNNISDSCRMGERVSGADQLSEDEDETRKRRNRDSVRWENAKAVVLRELKTESSGLGSGFGRPSIIQLLREKAGNVSATAKQYDAISCGGNSPVLNSNMLPNSCPRTAAGRGVERQPFSPVKIPQAFSHMSPARSKAGTPCADRTNSKMEPVFKTPLALSVPRAMKENSGTPTNRRRGSSGRAKARRSSSAGKGTPKNVRPRTQKVNSPRSASGKRLQTNVKRRSTTLRRSSNSGSDI